MKYNIVTSANKSYFPLLDVLISSIRKNCDLDKIQNIYIIDSGLDWCTSYFNDEKIKIVRTGLSDEYDGVHSKGWGKATRSKTNGLLKLFNEYDIKEPTILIDSDVCVLKDLSSIIDTNYDIQATVMHDGGHRRADGIFIKEIASFVCFNNIEFSKIFLNEWIQQIKTFEDTGVALPHETPAFNYTLRNNQSKMKISSLDENLVCADLKIFPETYSVHFKSNGPTQHDPVTNFFSRIRSAKNSTSTDYNFEQYLNKEGFNRWLVSVAQQGNRTLTLEEFTNYVDNLSDSGEFSFGFNWVDYVQKILSEPIIEIHRQDLNRIYDEAGLDIKGLNIIDIGSGSGLSSLALLRLGAKSIHSIDVDPYSVEASKLTKFKFGNNAENWNIEHKSVFDNDLGKYDLVYTWGVLHHTGDLSRAIDQAVNSVADNGYLHVALYRSGPNYPAHLAQKQYFASLDRKGKIEYLYNYTGGNPYMFNLDNRGMNTFHDALDWLGGLPYEVYNPDELNVRLSNFKRIYFRDGNCGGNFVAVYKKIN